MGAGASAEKYKYTPPPINNDGRAVPRTTPDPTVTPHNGDVSTIRIEDELNEVIADIVKDGIDEHQKPKLISKLAGLLESGELSEKTDIFRAANTDVRKLADKLDASDFVELMKKIYETDTRRERIYDSTVTALETIAQQMNAETLGGVLTKLEEEGKLDEGKVERVSRQFLRDVEDMVVEVAARNPATAADVSRVSRGYDDICRARAAIAKAIRKVAWKRNRHTSSIRDC